MYISTVKNRRETTLEIYIQIINILPTNTDTIQNSWLLWRLIWWTLLWCCHWWCWFIHLRSFKMLLYIAVLSIHNSLFFTFHLVVSSVSLDSFPAVCLFCVTTLRAMINSSQIPCMSTHIWPNKADSDSTEQKYIKIQTK